MFNFVDRPIEVDKYYVYLKTFQIGSSTKRKVKMIGECVEVKEDGNRPKFMCAWAEGYSRRVGCIDTVYGTEDVICEYRGEVSR